MILSGRSNAFIYIFILLFPALISSNAFAIYDKIAIDVTPQGNEVQFCFNFDTKSYLEGDYSKQLDKSFLMAITETFDIFFLSGGPQGLAVSTWQQGVEPPVFLPWTTETDSFCLPMLNRDLLESFDFYCAVGTSFSDAIENNRYVRFFDGALPTLPQPKKDWTVMVYMIGSDLEGEGLKNNKNASKDIVEMLNGTNNTVSDNFNLVLTTGGALRYGWDTVKRSWIHKGQQYVLEDLSAVSMTDPDTLESFLLWSVEKFPAEHYALVLWDHGGGAMGFGYDITNAGNGKKMLGLADLERVYTNTRNSIGRTLDAVVYDACLMASLEVIQTTSILGDAMAASAENVPWHGIDYSHLMSGLGSDKITSGIDFGKLAKESYIKQCKDQNEFDNNINGIPYKGITYTVFDLTQMPQFEESMAQFASAFKSAMEDGSYLSYEAASVGVINALGYPFKKAIQYRSLSDNHIRIDFGGFVNNLQSRLPAINDEVEQVQNSIQKLVADYEGNVAGIDRYSGEHSGRFSIDIGKDNTYMQVLPEYFTNISDGIIAYKQRMAGDQFAPASKLVCEQGVVCADFPNWLELSADDTFGLTVYTGWSDENAFQISRIKPVKLEEELSSDMTILLPLEDICSYRLCVNDSACQEITVKEINGMLLGEAVVNGINSILTFCPENEDEWSVCSVVGNSDDIWGREDSLYSGDSIKTMVMKKTGEKTETSENSSLTVNNPNQVVLKKDCSISDKTIVVTFYGINQEPQEVELCRGDECKDAGIIIRH